MPGAPLTGKAANAPVTPKDIWDALEAAGASSVQSAGIMGNMIAESALNPEAVNSSSGTVGLVQFDPSSYPVHGLVTGHPTADMLAQIKLLAQVGGFKAAKGNTPAEVANNFSASFERCQGCESGGSSNSYRQAQAAVVAGWAQSGSWPASSGAASDQAKLTASQQAQSSAECAWMLGGTVPIIPGFFSQSISGCIISKSQLRAIEGLALMAAGVVITIVGVELLFRVPESVAALALNILPAGRGARAAGGPRFTRGAAGGQPVPSSKQRGP